ncbi:MAG: class I SAM-dependent methyltransferase [Desulfobacterales bacterium]|nr:class I SAM-dependent methyltransferase [Desulfobacterales bacterium]
MNASIILKNQREKSVMRRHPWIFSGAVSTVKGNPKQGETVDVFNAQGVLLGRGAYSPHSQIMVRMWSFDPDEIISTDFFHSRLKRAIQARRDRQFISIDTNTACRLVYSESDGLPGIIIDKYADFFICQFLSSGAEHWKSTIVRELNECISCKGIFERSDVKVREKEGLLPIKGLLSGTIPPDVLEIHEGNDYFWVNTKDGQKTGFYLDQRNNRQVLKQYVNGAEVLNCFGYTGGFTISALHAGAAHVTHIETSAAAIELAKQNVILNGFSTACVDYVEANVFSILRHFREIKRAFDVIVLDPPKFAESMSQVERASRGYKDINLLAFQLLKPNGILVTFSCSAMLKRELFEKIVADAAIDAGRDAQIDRWLTQSEDHPCALNFPESSYLKGLVCRVW